MCLFPSIGDQFLTTNIYIAPAVIYVHTYIQMFMWFSGTSTIYFIRPKYCALLVQSNTRKELLLRKRICALGLLSDARSTEDVRHSFDRQSVPKINIFKQLLRVTINSCGFETFLFGVFRNFLTTRNYL